MNYKELQVANASIIALQEAHLTAENSADVKEHLLTLINKGKRRIIINISAVTFIDSSGIGSLMAISHALNQKDDFFALCSPQNPVKHILDVSHLKIAFRIFDTEEDAIQAITSK
jgi:anti-sigma B factor antagonist